MKQAYSTFSLFSRLTSKNKRRLSCTSALQSFLVSTCLLLSVSLAQAQVSQLQASVDKNPVMLDEALQLIITATGDVDNQQPDLSALRSDFNLSNTSVNRSTQMINFDTTYTTTWVTQLYPKKLGRFEIPAFTVGTKSSQPFTVEVIPVANGQGAQAREFYVTAELDTQQVYLHQQLRYTIKLHLAGDIQRGSLQAPQLDGAVIEQLGEDKEYSEIINGMRYRIIERNFAIVPQSSGRFTIGGPIFQGEVLAGGGRQGFGFINRTKTINRVGPSLELEVKGIPANYSYHWLPSEFVQLDEEWQGDINTLVVGEPITRTFTLTAAGLVKEQLPDIEANYPPNFKTYPDQATTATVDQNNLLIAQRVQSMAIIPNKAGTFVLPEVIVPWFNVLTQQTEFARLPARSVKVEAAAASAGNAANYAPIANQAQNIDANQQTAPASSPLNMPLEGRLLGKTIMGVYVDVLHLALTGLWIVSMLTMVHFYRQRATASQPASKSLSPYLSSQAKDENQAWKALVEASEKSQALKLQQALGAWFYAIDAKFHKQDVATTLATVSPEVLQQYNALMASTYASPSHQHTHQFNSTAFIKALREYRKAQKKATQDTLAALYAN